jgi:hypothetical protein
VVAGAPYAGTACWPSSPGPSNASAPPHPAEGRKPQRFPTLYLDSSYSRHLNREGLYIAAEAVERKTDAAPAPASRGKRSVRDTGSEDKELAAAAV